MSEGQGRYARLFTYLMRLAHKVPHLCPSLNPYIPCHARNPMYIAQHVFLQQQYPHHVTHEPFNAASHSGELIVLYWKITPTNAVTGPGMKPESHLYREHGTCLLQHAVCHTYKLTVCSFYISHHAPGI